MAGNFVNTTLEVPTYSVVINSYNKLAGTTNNNAQFQINWDDFLPRNFQKYKVAFNFQTTGGKYTDGNYTVNGNLTACVFSSATVKVNFGGRSYSFDTNSLGPSTTLGVIQRDIQTTTTSSNTLGCYYLYNPPRTISRPNTNIITVQVLNQALTTATTTVYLTDTGTAPALAADMTNWTAFLEFIPIADDVVKTQNVG